MDLWIYNVVFVIHKSIFVTQNSFLFVLSVPEVINRIHQKDPKVQNCRVIFFIFGCCGLKYCKMPLISRTSCKAASQSSCGLDSPMEAFCNVSFQPPLCALLKYVALQPSVIPLSAHAWFLKENRGQHILVFQLYPLP